MVAALPLKRMSSLRMEFSHALLGKGVQLRGRVSVFPVDNNVQRSLHAFEAHDEPWGIYTMGSNGEWDAYAKRCSDHFSAGCSQTPRGAVERSSFLFGQPEADYLGLVDHHQSLSSGLAGGGFAVSF